MSWMVRAEVVVKAQFYDLDPMGVVWHGHYARFLEQARCALLDRIGYNYEEMRDSGYVWPIVDMRIKYVRPIEFSQEIRIIATLTEYEYRLRITYEIFDHDGGAPLTKAETVQVAVVQGTQELCFESPSVLIEKVRRLLACE